MLNFAETKKKDFGRAEDGAYPARVVQIIDLGFQLETDYKTGEPKTFEDGNPMIRHKVWINFELPTETLEIDGENKPRWYGKEFAVSSHEKSALYGLLRSVDGKGEFTNKGRNVRGLLGLPAMVTIGSTSSGKAKVSGVSGIPKGMQVDPLQNPTVYFDLDSDDVETFESLPKWIQERIKTGIRFDETKFYQKVNREDYVNKNIPISVGDY